MVLMDPSGSGLQLQDMSTSRMTTPAVPAHEPLRVQLQRVALEQDARELSRRRKLRSSLVEGYRSCTLLLLFLSQGQRKPGLWGSLRTDSSQTDQPLSVSCTEAATQIAIEIYSELAKRH